MYSTIMDIQDFDYNLPHTLIAQKPTTKRHESRLLVVNRKTTSLEHRLFSDLPEYLNENDVIVLNDTKVINARLEAHRKTGGVVEIFCLRPENNSTWRVLLNPAKRIKEGEYLQLSDRSLVKVLKKNISKSEHLIHFEEHKNVYRLLETLGSVPLPPYITPTNNQNWQARYQTVYAQKPGAVAAPTAGLHFSNDLLSILREKGVQIETVTLHVGIGTFQPIKVDLLKDHKMHSEQYDIPKDTAIRLIEAIRKGKRIVSVGTTVTRTLESAYTHLSFKSGENETSLFIYPGYSFQAVSAMITNFHLPKSSLLVMISAFMGREFALEVYKEAISKKYRFFSFGDGMLVI
ncbi:MAG: tRNA preQ1(34) S-adenosylmethionine ribosyltransferase-isomerase QueA [Candidatus Margulisbacteria bacterium]|nr:tRNA preQ1(34) S-adenosylmethionine ribosyltransferase-isomerase QueA [Candidatus Margulisiibacteriota bacterium]